MSTFPQKIPGPGTYSFSDSPFGDPKPLPAIVQHMKKKHGLSVTWNMLQYLFTLYPFLCNHWYFRLYFVLFRVCKWLSILFIINFESIQQWRHKSLGIHIHHTHEMVYTVYRETSNSFVWNLQHKRYKEEKYDTTIKLGGRGQSYT